MKIPNPEKELNFKFSKKPLLFGGGAIEYYGLRKRGKDVGFIISNKDYESLLKLYPKNKKIFEGDSGIVIGYFEFWKSFCHFDYNYLTKESTEEKNFLVISLEKQLLLKSIGVLLFARKSSRKVIKKYTRDVILIHKKLEDS